MRNRSDFALGLLLGIVFLLLSHSCGLHAGGLQRAQLFHADDGATCYAIYNDADELRAGNCK